MFAHKQGIIGNIVVYNKKGNLKLACWLHQIYVQAGNDI